MAKLAIIKVRGQVRNNGKRHRAMNLLGIAKKFSVMVVDDTPAIRNQIKLLTPDITWGDASEEIASALSKKFPKQKVYHLNPPKGGLGRKGVKTGYNKKGAFGYRAAKINDLLKKMM